MGGERAALTRSAPEESGRTLEPFDGLGQGVARCEWSRQLYTEKRGHVKQLALLQTNSLVATPIPWVQAVLPSQVINPTKSGSPILYLKFLYINRRCGPSGEINAALTTYHLHHHGNRKPHVWKHGSWRKCDMMNMVFIRLTHFQFLKQPSSRVPQKHLWFTRETSRINTAGLIP